MRRSIKTLLALLALAEDALETLPTVVCVRGLGLAQLYRSAAWAPLGRAVFLDVNLLDLGPPRLYVHLWHRREHCLLRTLIDMLLGKRRYPPVPRSWHRICRRSCHTFDQRCRPSFVRSSAPHSRHSEDAPVCGHQMFSRSDDEADPAAYIPTVLELPHTLLGLRNLEQHRFPHGNQLCIGSAAFHQLVCRPTVFPYSAHGQDVPCMPHDPWHQRTRQLHWAADLRL